MRRSHEVTSKCYHCGAVGTHARETLMGSWVVCAACGRPHHWKVNPRVGRRVMGLALLLALWAGALTAQQAVAPKPLAVTAENLMAGDERHQALAATGGDAATVLPGDVVRYRLRFTNVTQGEVRGVVFTNPVPDGLHYVAGSAGADREDVVAEYSIDGGRTYSARPMVVEVVDGKRVEKPAPPERYSHVRWTVRGSISPGAAVTAEFRAVLQPAATPEDPSFQDESTRR